eukprot:TRINITY_DN4218_c0_g1_i1.p4 TRINITY_DN4218_c0_g1~~TRINITY_DN4218_c0_g1_i1.p4  ORF type:complete len:57 (+),score=8.69 TRINITY_DN4218_c0_g1_i1:135-305(+)
MAEMRKLLHILLSEGSLTGQPSFAEPKSLTQMAREEDVAGAQVAGELAIAVDDENM